MANNYTAIPHAYLDECAELTDAEFGELIRALMRYGMTGEVIAVEGNGRFFARRFMRQEDVFRERYRDICEKRREAGRLGAAVTNQKRRAGGNQA